MALRQKVAGIGIDQGNPMASRIIRGVLCPDAVAHGHDRMLADFGTCHPDFTVFDHGLGEGVFFGICQGCVDKGDKILGDVLMRIVGHPPGNILPR